MEEVRARSESARAPSKHESACDEATALPGGPTRPAPQQALPNHCSTLWPQVFNRVLEKRAEAATEAAELAAKEFSDEEAACARDRLERARQRVTVSVYEVRGKVFDLLNADKASPQITPRGQALVRGHGFLCGPHRAALSPPPFSFSLSAPLSTPLLRTTLRLRSSASPLPADCTAPASARPQAAGAAAAARDGAGGQGHRPTLLLGQGRRRKRAVETANEAIALMRDSQRLRHTASHALNEASSRSHCIFSLQVYRRRHGEAHAERRRRGAGAGKFSARGVANKTRANLVDLAGSEDARDTQAEGATLREAGDNKSLFTLRKAIEYLA